MEFDKTLYDKRALIKAAYAFTDRVYIHLAQTQKAWCVSWTPKDGCEPKPEEFENELIVQQLRLQLVQDSGEIRKILLGRAMASTLVERPAARPSPAIETKESGDTEDILKGWFERDGV